jgi:NADPH-dependent curcumin reductase CurA
MSSSWGWGRLGPGRFLVLDYKEEWDGALAELTELVLLGKVVAPETITEGFCPGDAFCEMMAGANLGKAIVVVNPDAGRRG